ncbi:hypothetical protein LCI18_002604 [Fusarium solani-melongenae]|uniref:Uncharacterized protein n=1 Tax=Fusarium solani subsp. cucurbitae TaxID=2747967 RepID=A0ACD3YRR7_FUSSC|nr:hypothetical protein LCI18_002604 [Fusarium solani-melongenae]
MRGSSAVVWLREKNPWKPPEPGMPYLPAERPRPLTASSESQGSKESPFFTKLPKEIRLEILCQAIGGTDIHIELDYDYPATLRKLPTKNHASRISFQYGETWCNRTHTCWEKHVIVPNRWKSKKWRWWSCVCHRLGWTPFDGTARMAEDDLSFDRCKYGVNEWCKSTPGEVPSKCHVGAMGWLLCCRQAYREGIQVLYSTNAFLLSNTELILSLPKLLVPSRLESITRVEMLGRIHPFREHLEMLYISLLGDMYAAEGDTCHDNYATEHVYRKVEQVVMKPMEDMIKKFPHLSTCIIALPSSCYGAEKRHALDNGGRVLERRSHKAERIWRELRGAPTLDGYWIQIGHRDMGGPYWLENLIGFYEPPEREPEPMDILYTMAGCSPWGDNGGRLINPYT